MAQRKFQLVVLVLLSFFLSSQELDAQMQSSVEELSKFLNQALIERNENQLDQLLHPDLSYGHSNGWVENKEELIRNNQTKYLFYEKISMDSVTVKYSGNISILRCQSLIDAVLNGKSVNLKLHILQIWIKEKDKWKMLARQSTKIN